MSETVQQYSVTLRTMCYGNDTSIHISKEVWPICFFLNCGKRLDLKAMVRRISILLWRRSRKLSKSSTPFRTLVAKYITDLATIKQ